MLIPSGCNMLYPLELMKKLRTHLGSQEQLLVEDCPRDNSVPQISLNISALATWRSGQNAYHSTKG